MKTKEQKFHTNLRTTRSLLVHEQTLSLSLSHQSWLQAAESRKVSTPATPSSTANKREDRRERVNEAQHYGHLYLASLGDRTGRKPPTQVLPGDHFASCTCHLSSSLLKVKPFKEYQMGRSLYAV
jgi:hypothetical protein